MPSLESQRIFDTQEMARNEILASYEQYVRENKRRLGDLAVASMITVVQHNIPPHTTDSGETTSITGSYEVLPGITLPKDFEPPETSEPGYGDRLYFLSPDQAVPVVDQEGSSHIIVNSNGKDGQVENTPKILRTLRKQGIKIQDRPAQLPYTPRHSRLETTSK